MARRKFTTKFKAKVAIEALKEKSREEVKMKGSSLEREGRQSTENYRTTKS